MEITLNAKLEKACVEAKEKLSTLGIEEKLVAEIEWCLGSYEYDHNPDGLYAKATQALEVLETYKKTNPRGVSKKLIEDISKAVRSN